VQVHIVTTEKELRLYRANGNPNGECRAPCDAPVARATDSFMLAGAGLVPSNPFVLIDHARGGRVSMKVKAGSAAGFFIGGTLLTTAAIAGLIIGFVFISRDPTAGALGLGLGTAAGVGGVLSFVLNGTTVTFEGD